MLFLAKVGVGSVVLASVVAILLVGFTFPIIFFSLLAILFAWMVGDMLHGSMK